MKLSLASIVASAIVSVMMFVAGAHSHELVDKGKVIAMAQGTTDSLLLFDAPGSCLNGALRAEYKDGDTTLPGCWKITPEGVQVVLLSADALVVPFHVFTKPKSA